MVNLSPYHSLYSLLLLILVSSFASNALAAECSATKLCPLGCCSQYGFCGFEPEHCGDGCLSTCDAEETDPGGGEGQCSASVPCKEGCCSEHGSCGFGEKFCSKEKGCLNNCGRKSECDPGWGMEWSESEKCPLNVCCSEFGFCGTTKEFCGDDDEIDRPSCSSDHKINRVVGYYEQWSMTRGGKRMSPNQIPMGYYTHLNFAFASINPTTFEIAPSSEGDEELWRRIQSIRILQPDIEIWIAIGGWTFNDANQPTHTTFSDIARSESNQKAFIRSLLSMMGTYGFDGVDIDWEYPVAKDRSGREEDFENFPKFTKNLQSVLKNGGKKYGLSLTLPASYWYLQHFDIKALQDTVDWFNIMSYDLHGLWDQGNEWVGPYIGAHTNLTEIKQALDLLWRNDIDPDKVIMGMAFYGRSFTLGDPACSEPGCTFTSGGAAAPGSNTVGVLLNTEISDIISANGLKPTLYEDAAVKAVNWGDQWVSFDDEDTFKLKGDFAKSQCLGGAMVWAVSHDYSTGTFAKQLTSGLGRETIELPDYSEPLPSTDGPSLVETCKWMNCGEDCPSGWKWIDREGTDLKMTDETGCVSGVGGHKFCCPGDKELPQCIWRGMPSTGGACSSGCDDGEVEVGTLALYCTSDHQSACCTDVPSTSAYGMCKWVGSAPTCSDAGGHADCPSDYPNFLVAASQGAGGEQVCATGSKSYCCKDVPSQFTVCTWRSNTDIPLWCDPSCPKDDIRLSMQRGGCPGGLEAFCCKGQELGVIEPRDPGHRFFQEFVRLNEEFTEDPTLPSNLESSSWALADTTAISKRELASYDFYRYATLFTTVAENPFSLEAIKEEWDDDGPPSKYGKHLTVSGFNDYVGQGDGIGLDTYAVAIDVLRNIRTAQTAMDAYDTAQEDLCVLTDSATASKRALKSSGTQTDWDGEDSEPEYNSYTNKVIEDRHINNVVTFYGPTQNSEPRMSSILQGILDNRLTLNYARWQWFNAANGVGTPGPFLELAYWIGPEVGVQGEDIAFYQDQPDDRWVIFHLHFANDRDNSRLRGRPAVRHFGTTSIMAFHGQERVPVPNQDPRVGGDDRDRGGRNTRVRALECPPGQRWYIDESEAPGVVEGHYYANLLAQWGHRLFEEGYVDEYSFGFLYPRPRNPADDRFRPNNFRGRNIMRDNWLAYGNAPPIPD